MDGTDQPAEADVGHEVLNGGVGLGDRWLVIKRHREAGGELNQKAHQGDAAKAIKNIDVRRDVLRGDIVGDRLDLEALFKPVVDRVGVRVRCGRGGIRHAAWGLGCESLPIVVTGL